MTTLFPHIKQELSTANSFQRQKYGRSCSFTLESHPNKTKSVTFEIIGPLFETSPISLDITGPWMSSVINTSFFTVEELSFSFEGKRLKTSAFEFSEPLRYFRL